MCPISNAPISDPYNPLEFVKTFFYTLYIYAVIVYASGKKTNFTKASSDCVTTYFDHFTNLTNTNYVFGSEIICFTGHLA
jgi:hypothetical protein